MCSNFASASVSEKASSESLKLYSCQGDYALCSASLCAKSSNGKSAVCKCPIYNGTNLGGTTCKKRSSVGEGFVYSDYSPKFLTDSGSKLFKPGEVCKNQDSSQPLAYADCFDIKCKVSKNDPSKAICKCPVLSNNKMIQLQSESCDKSEKLCQYLVPKSKHVVVNSAPTLFGDRVIIQSLRDEGFHFNPKKMMCPKN